MKKMALVLAAVLASGMVLTACGGSGNAAKETTGNNTSTTTTATGGLDLAVQVGPDPETVDPALNTAIDASNIILHAFETLLTFDENNDIVPGQAESFDVSDDGLTYTFHLRDDVKWSDGEPVTADDYVYGMKQTLDPEAGSPNAFYITCIKNGEAIYNGEKDVSELGVKAVDDKTLEITLEYSVPYFLSLTDTRAMYPVREDLVEKYGESYGANVESMVGCGPFKMTSWKRNSKIELEKNENYWDKDSVKLDKVNYQIVSDQTARFNSFDSGSLDYVACADKEWIGRFDKKDKVDVVEAPIPTVRYDFFNCQDKIFSNVNIRKAFTMAVNREDMCSVIYNDIHKPLYSWVPYSTSTGELGEYRDQVEEPLKSITEDPKELLLKGMQELGLGSDPSTLSITYTLSGTTEWTRNYAAYCQQMWEKILGVKVELDFNEWGTFQSKTNNGEFQIAMMTWSIDYDDPMAMMEVFAGGSNMVPVFWQNEQYDSLVAQARKEMDEKTRVDLYKQAENILLAEDCVISPNVNECTHSYYYQYVKNYNKLASSTSGLKYVDTSAR